MKIIEATHFGMCFGVRDAVALAEAEALKGGVTVLGDLVHNPDVLERLRKKGVAFARDLAEVRGGKVMITAHGASDKRIAEVKQRHLEVVEATCPLVRFAHRAVEELVRDGYFPVVIGQPGHVEVKGLTEDLQEVAVVRCDEDIDQLPHRPRYGVAAQTTQPLDRVKHFVDRIRRQFPESEVRWIDTVCQPTKQRQLAAVRLAMESDVVVVVGGRQSNNTRELVETCQRHCSSVHLVERSTELNAGWFLHAETVGMTAGTSTPDWVIEDVRRHLREIATTLHRKESLA